MQKNIRVNPVMWYTDQVCLPDSGWGTWTMVLLYEHWLVTETTLMALVDIVMSVRGAPTTAAAVGATDTSLSNTTTGHKGDTTWRTAEITFAKKIKNK